MLELLASPLLIAVRYCFVIDFNHIREAVHNECTQEDCVRNFVFLYRQAHQICERFQFGYLNETVYIVVLEKQAL